MDILRQIQAAQASWFPDDLVAANMQGMRDARTLLMQAVADRNETMIRIYSETCLLLLEANRKQAADWMALMTPKGD